MAKTRKPALTVEDIEAGYGHDEWLGWGYLKGREELEPARRAAADEVVLAHANAHGWSAAQLFEWCNSRPGRHFADWPEHPKASALLSVDLSR